jgi:ribosomal protein S18 acetylase RimI-like enzyme
MKSYSLIVFSCSVIILTVFLIICNNTETFRMPTLKDTDFLTKYCFNADDIKPYEQYYGVADVKEQKNKALVFTTPINQIKELSNFNLSQYGNGLFINNMCVNPKHRRKGIAKKMISNIIENARNDNNINFLFLQVKNSNKPAFKLYSEFEFKEQRRFTGSKGETYVNMMMKV